MIMGQVPKHIGFILDGNRRFSKRLMMKPWKGHEWGAKKVRQVLEWAKEKGIREITLYTFSVENFNRPKEEFNYLMELFRREFDRLIKDKQIYENEIRINVIGRLHLFPEDVQKRLREIMEKTKSFSRYIVNFAMGYGGRAEVVDAARRIAEAVKENRLDIDQINEEVFAKNLYLQDEPDMIIRTGGEVRTSNFLPFQAAYSEWIFIDKMWPEFEKEDFEECLHEYARRERRFGK